MLDSIYIAKSLNDGSFRRNSAGGLYLADKVELIDLITLDSFSVHLYNINLKRNELLSLISKKEDVVDLDDVFVSAGHPTEPVSEIIAKGTLLSELKILNAVKSDNANELLFCEKNVKFETPALVVKYKCYRDKGSFEFYMEFKNSTTDNNILWGIRHNEVAYINGLRLNWQSYSFSDYPNIDFEWRTSEYMRKYHSIQNLEARYEILFGGFPEIYVNLDNTIFLVDDLDRALGAARNSFTSFSRNADSRLITKNEYETFRRKLFIEGLR